MDTVDVDEPGVAEQAGELGLVGEAVERRPGRQVGRRRRADLLDGVVEHAGQPGRGGHVPGGEGHLPAGRQHPGELGRRPLRPAEVRDGEVGDHRVERVVGEPEVLGVAVDELDPAGAASGPAPPSRGATSTPTAVASRAAAAAATYPGPLPTSSTRTPGPTAAASRSGSMTWLVSGSERPVVGGRPLLPAGGLERVEGIGIDLRYSSVTSRLGSVVDLDSRVAVSTAGRIGHVALLSAGAGA